MAFGHPDKLVLLWQHASACLRGGSRSGPPAGAEWTAEIAQRALAEIWQIYASGEHSKQIYTNVRFRIVRVRLMQQVLHVSSSFEKNSMLQRESC